MEYIKLNNGVKMPAMGFGTIGQSGDSLIDNVSYALDHGYELIDTANRYGNEVEVGKGIKASKEKREDMFLQTKLGPTLYENDQAIDDTLKRLDVDYVDLLLLHHPVNNYIYAYKMLEKAYKEGKVKAIGVSNFSVEQLEELIEKCDIVSQVMQVECHPYYPAEKVRDFCESHHIVLQSWFPLGHGSKEMINEPVFVELGKKYHKTPVQVVLRWHVENGFGLVPGSSSHEHLLQNLDIFDFSLAKEDLEEIGKINKHEPFYKVKKESLQMLATTKCNFEE